VIDHAWSLVSAFFQPLVRFRTDNPHCKRFSLLWDVFAAGVGVGQFGGSSQAVWLPNPVKIPVEFEDFSIGVAFHESR
jgi:hypothetical protein